MITKSQLWAKVRGGSPVPPRSPVPSTIPLPCVHEGAVLEYCKTCGGNEGRHVRDCDLHDRCTRTFVSAAVRSCDRCPDRQAPYSVHLGHARGIGDTISGLYAACGLASSLQKPVTYYARNFEWLAGVSHPWLTLAPYDRLGADPTVDYGGELSAANTGTCPSRVQWYCDRLAQQLGVRPFSGRRPATVANPPPVIGRGYHLLVPQSADQTRQWSMANWAELAAKLTADGERVVVLGGPTSTRLVETRFAGTGAEVYADRVAHWATSVVAHAGVMYGNDSGMAHVAGLRSVPAVAVVAQMRPSFLFGDLAPTVSGVTPDAARWACQGCGWRGPNYLPSCPKVCDALQSISVDKVRAARG